MTKYTCAKIGAFAGGILGGTFGTYKGIQLGDPTIAKAYTIMSTAAGIAGGAALGGLADKVMQLFNKVKQ